MCIKHEKHKFILCPGISLEFLIDKYVVQENFFCSNLGFFNNMFLGKKKLLHVLRCEHTARRLEDECCVCHVV